MNRDRSALLSPSFDSALFTISPLSTQTEGWDDFVFDFAEFAAKHTACRSSIRPQCVAGARVATFGARLGFFNKVRRELDPHDRLLNQYFGAYLQPSSVYGVAAAEDEAQTLELHDDAVRGEIRCELSGVDAISGFSGTSYGSRCR